MYCPKCGAVNEDGARFCTNCGEGLNGQPAAPEPPYQPAAPEYAAPAAPDRIAEAKSCMVQGILSVGFSAVPVLPIILGAKAKSKAKRLLDESAANGTPRMGMAVAGRITGIIGLVAGILALVSYAITILNFIVQ